MKIAVEATPLMSKSTGIERFVYFILRELAKLDAENEYILYYQGGLGYKKRTPPKFNFKKYKYKIIKIPLQVLNFFIDYFKFPPMEAFIGKPDLFWATNYQIPVFWNTTKTVNTIYDVSAFIYPEHYTESLHRIKKNMPMSAKKADIILTISESAKNDIQRILEVPSEKIKVVYCGVSDDFCVVKDAYALQNIKNKYAGGKNFILSVGTLNPRKNFIKLIEAFDIIRKNIGIKLVIAGKKGWLFEGIYSKVKELNLEGQVVFTDCVTDKELNLLYNVSSVFVFPSLYEGFGIPIIEAFTCGAPVCASNASSMPEVAGDAALYFDPNNEKEMASSVLKMLQNKPLRDKFVEKGFERVKKFSWKTSAIKLLEIFKSM